jgi:transcriptional regulator with XRE-family HTH domain
LIRAQVSAGPRRPAITWQVIEYARRAGHGGLDAGVLIVPSATTPLEFGPGADGAFPRLLKTWRLRRRLSQLDLALTSGVSQRHVSFLESGRARPSRTMILQLSETLDVPLRDRNDWLIAAGFAPAFRARALDDPGMAQVMTAVRMMLSNHEPFPAIAIDRAWNIRLANAAFERMSALLGAALGEDVWRRIGGPERNMMRLFFHPGGLAPFIANRAVIAPLLWRRAQREAEALGGGDMRRVLAELAPHQDAATLAAASADGALMPVLSFEIEVGGARIALFAVIATFGTAQDVTADELRIESLFPADAATEALFRGAAGGEA